MKYFIIFFSSLLFAFNNELYIKILENNMVIGYLSHSIYKTKEMKLNPKIKEIITTSPDKFIVGNAKVDTKGNKKVSIGMEFDFQKKTNRIILTNNKEIFKIDKYFKKNRKLIKCYENMVLFNLKIFFMEVSRYDSFYMKFLPLLKYASPCHTTKPLTFFKLKKEKNDVSPLFSITKKRNITSNININLNQDTSTYVSASFNIKIPLQKSYDDQDLKKLQNINTSMNKINLLILKINNSIDNYKEILRNNKIILANLKLLTLVSKISPANLNYEKLISLYENFFKNLKTLNSIQRDIFINKFLLKLEKRKLSEY